MNKSTKFLLASVSPAALAAGWAMLDAAPAHATITIGAQNVIYAAENFTGTSAASSIIVAANGIRANSSNTTSDFASGFVTFTLSNSATFAAAPPVTNSFNITLGTGSLVSTSTAVTYATTVTTATTNITFTLGNFTITGVGTRLATSVNTITVAYATTGSSTPTNISATIAASAQAYSFTATTTAVTVDLANSGSGVVFRTAAPASNVSFALLGTLVNNAAIPSNDISGAAQFTVTSSDTLRAIVGGNFSAFSSVYAASASCAATAPGGAITATISTDQRSATMSPTAIGSTYNICAIANGTTIIPAGSVTGSGSVSYGARTVSGATYTPGAYSQSASTLTTIGYNGSTATAYYVVGLGSYISAIRLTNNSATNGSVFVQVTPDTTGTPIRALLDSTLAAGQSKFYLASDIRTAVGTTVLADSNTRATVVFLTSFTGLALQNFIVNPGGVLSGGTSVSTGNVTGN